MENKDTSAEIIKKDTCAMDEKDARGNTNACCCYVMTPDGRYEDPCFYPAGSCC